MWYFYVIAPASSYRSMRELQSNMVMYQVIKANAIPKCEGEGQPGLSEPWVLTPALPLPRGLTRASHLACQTHPESVSSSAQ